jgi:hypothetical protein
MSNKPPRIKVKENDQQEEEEEDMLTTTTRQHHRPIIIEDDDQYDMDDSDGGGAVRPHKSFMEPSTEVALLSRKVSLTSSEGYNHHDQLNNSSSNSIMFPPPLQSTTSAGSSITTPLWGEPGRRLPSVSSMLQLPPLSIPPSTARNNSSTNNDLPEDIEDLGKEDKGREGLLIEELVQASPRVLVEFSQTNSLCPTCQKPSKFGGLYYQAFIVMLFTNIV